MDQPASLTIGNATVSTHEIAAPGKYALLAESGSSFGNHTLTPKQYGVQITDASGNGITLTAASKKVAVDLIPGDLSLPFTGGNTTASVELHIVKLPD